MNAGIYVGTLRNLQLYCNVIFDLRYMAFIRFDTIVADIEGTFTSKTSRNLGREAAWNAEVSTVLRLLDNSASVIILCSTNVDKLFQSVKCLDDFHIT